MTVCEPRPARRALGESLGAARVLEPEALRVPPMPFTVVEDAVDVVFECSGRAEAFEAGWSAGTSAPREVVGRGLTRQSPR